MSAPPARWAFEAIGTAWTVETPEPVPASARAAVAERIARFDLDWSRFREDSLVTRMSREPGRHRLPAEAAGLLELYRILHGATLGRVSPLVGRSLERLGYDAAYRLAPSGPPLPAAAWGDVLAWDGEHLDLARPALLDVGAAGKGLLVDLVGALLAELGHPDSLVDASGDLRHRGRGAVPGRPERIALEHPGDRSRAIGVAVLEGGALAASAANRRAWGDAHHILDALTGLPAREVAATWVTTVEAMWADGLATALFVADPAELAAAPGAPSFEWTRMMSDGRVEHSPGFQGEVFA
ncbi:FAD:protein FMN transferase [Homoserinibacter sp. YIM 151385]|uniref:FAD:protein FMN transferase n=1 Tax=Homoserinibacter sp. YIM 151385 TaxID=2985506 RepID=UPI0022F08BD1|nr:FAD:protein FMN transferase [Homoserinibacter sp. YIM 151385]WBU36779.1 FAD:protein FMN transferase [Homoserinibacter sp. YIM 151385]